ncbi:MAG: DUF2914 domain-containing protein [Candidatus Paceibacteria bacterium]
MEFFERLQNFFWIRKAKDFYHQYERLLLPGALLVGLVVDGLTFRNIDIDTAFSLLTFYLVLSALTIAYIHLYKEKILPSSKPLETIYVYAPVVIQFTFGALLSAIFIFYFFSGTVWISWPLFLLLVVLMGVNDGFRKYYTKAEVQLSIYYFILLLFFILVFPFLFSNIGAGVFLLSGIASLLVFFGLFKLLLYLSTEIDIKRKGISAIVFVIFLVVNVLYFTNIIPPIPLSVRDSGVYYNVERVNGDYRVLAPQQSWFDYLSDNKLKIKDDSEIYVYTAIFAPSGLHEQIIHQWKRYDRESESWVTTDRLSFPLFGGRDEGYRGYSKKTNLKQGSWRVEVKTQNGKVLDIIDFRLDSTEEQIQTETKVKT